MSRRLPAPAVLHTTEPRDYPFARAQVFDISKAEALRRLLAAHHVAHAARATTTHGPQPVSRVRAVSWLRAVFVR